MTRRDFLSGVFPSLAAVAFGAGAVARSAFEPDGVIREDTTLLLADGVELRIDPDRQPNWPGIDHYSHVLAKFEPGWDKPRPGLYLDPTEVYGRSPLASAFEKFDAEVFLRELAKTPAFKP